ncbi:hypothetical protein B1F69_03840, partial [Pseudomonas syringae]
MSAEDPRFAGIARLYGIEGLARLRAAHVAVVGIGGGGAPGGGGPGRGGGGGGLLCGKGGVWVCENKTPMYGLTRRGGAGERAGGGWRVHPGQ